MSSRPTVWFARHARVDAPGLCYGRTDVPTLHDDQTAADVLLGGLPALRGRAALTCVWTSPRARCLGPATILATKLGLPLEVDARLAELDMGAWDGLPFADIEQRWPDEYARWMAHWQTAAPPRGESARDLQQRAGSWWDQRIASTKGVHAIVGHAGVFRALSVHTEGITWLEAMNRVVPFLGWLCVGPEAPHSSIGR